MAVWNCMLWSALVLWWMLISESRCGTQHQSEEEIFHSDKQTDVKWTSEPPRTWTKVKKVLQACQPNTKGTFLSSWMERQGANRLLMDIVFTQEQESSSHTSKLQVHLFDLDTSIQRFHSSSQILDLQDPNPFPASHPDPISGNFTYIRAQPLGSISRRGFQVAFSYSGTCVLIKSIRLYYRRCPAIVSDLVMFGSVGASSGPTLGSCLEGAVEVSPPERECTVDGVWGPLQGKCTCIPGHQVVDETCQACRMGYYKVAWGNEDCQRCPVNTGTHKEGSERCDCLQGFSRLPSDPDDLGCTRKIPPAVITVTPSSNISGPDIVPTAQSNSRFIPWLTIGVLFSILLLVAVIPIVVCYLRQNYTKLRSDPGFRPSDMTGVVTYRRPLMEEAADQQSDTEEGVVQLLEGLSGRLLTSLKEVLVERNRLTLGKELGKGEFGSVYEGVFTPEIGVDIKVAVKTMRVGIHSQEDLHEFLREAEIMKNFDHENVVGLLGVTLQREQDSTLPVPLVILPYMKHGDLRRFLIAIRYGDIPMFVPHQSLLRFMIDIASGMDYLSSQGFVHRDLAARNCMLGDDLRVCVADFGLSKKIYSSNYYRQKVAIRVPIKWMAMESLSESIYTSKSDVWAFGVTMWEIVSWGRTPYPGVHNHELLDLLMSGHRLKPPQDCDQKLYEVMWSCWDKNPTQRPGFRDLVEALKGLLSELPVLEASQEAGYINQGLEAAAAFSATQQPQTDSRERWENIYLPTPMGATAAAREEDVDVENGYLKYVPDLTFEDMDN
ncbi:tyrosine-protein kinase Mer isoform 3-T3 [Pholidichthys leucotaenia]